MIDSTLAFCTPRRALQRQALAVGRAAHAVGQHLLADAVDELVVEIVADQLQHHVERGGAAGAGVDVLVDLEEIGEDIGLREGLGEARQVLPMDGAALVGQQAGRGQHMRAGAQPADGDAAIILLAQPGKGRVVVVVLDVDAAADDDHRRPVRPGHLAPLVLERGVDRAFDAVGGLHRLAVDAGQPPAVGFVAEHAVGERNGSSAVAKATMVKSGTRKKTSDRLIGCLVTFKVASPCTMSRTGCRDQQSVIRKTVCCQWGGWRRGMKFATCVIADLPHQRVLCSKTQEKTAAREASLAAAVECRRAVIRLEPGYCDVS